MITLLEADRKIALLLICLLKVYKTPKDIRLNCSHYAVYNFPISNERNMISRELGVTKSQHVKANENPFSFLYVDKPMEKNQKKFYGNI